MAFLNELQGEHLTQPILIPSMPESSATTKLPNDSDRAGRMSSEKHRSCFGTISEAAAETAEHQSPKHREVEQREHTHDR